MTRKYSGDLAKPIKLAPLGLLYTPEQYAARRKEHITELERRMGLLFEAHGVMAGDLNSLCWRLALDLPGFQLSSSKPLGRPKRWDEFTRVVLALCFEELRALGFSITEAAQRLANEEPWRSMVRHADGAKRLIRESTREPDPRLLSMMRDGRESMIASGEITDEPGAIAHKYLAVIYAQDEPQIEQ